MPPAIPLVRVTGCRLDKERLPDGVAKERLLNAIEKARKVIALASVLKVVRVSNARYHTWNRRGKACELTDRSSCPKKSPDQLTVAEIEGIRQLATSDQYRHMPTSTLSRFAQRAGKVYASASTWLRLIRERGWRRPRKRIHPAKPSVGIRASAAVVLLELALYDDPSYHSQMKVTAILPDELVADVRHLARGKTLTDSLRTALEDWTRNKRAVMLAQAVRKKPLSFTKTAREGGLRELNRR